LKLACVVGARPNFIKMAALIAEFRRRPWFDVRLIHTGQHFSPEMSQAFFDDLELPAPDLNLEVSGGTGTSQTAEVMRRLEQVFLEQRPDLLVVVGDVNSTLAAALVAAKLGIPIAHVESGLRSFDRTMPEEINRVLTDAISTYLFVTEPNGVANLLAEGVPQARIHFVGNVMIDTLLRFRDKAALSGILEELGLQKKEYAVATLHRPSNVDSPESLRGLFDVLAQLATRLPVVFPVHPRTRGRMQETGLTAPNLLLTTPLGYLDFVRLISEARLVLTDSGGIQEETTILQVPCLTLRDNTERPVTIEKGTNRLAGTDPRRILETAIETLNANGMQARVPELWDGMAGARIADVLEQAVPGQQAAAVRSGPYSRG
jgi:UDP-N-acetylglucosamine 2-epimerase (non-hydrolysing)